MRELVIGLDCDGVLGDFVSAVLRVVKEVTGKSFTPADVTEWNFARALGLSAGEKRAVMKAIGACRGFALSILPYPQARQGVRRLRELGEVFCVTNPWDFNPWWCSERDSWLALHFGIDRVHHTSDKARYEAHVFVDDKSAHVRAWLTAWPGRTAVLWRTPHNTGEAVPRGAHSVSSWEALYQVAWETARDFVQPSLSMAEGTP